MTNPTDTEQMKDLLIRLETENKHLHNELKLAEEEKETARKNYFDIISNMEEKVALRTGETRELQKIAEAKNEELQIMLDSSHAMIFYKNLKQRYIRVNKEFARVVGIPISKIIGKSFHDIFPDSDSGFLEDDLEVMQTGKPVLNTS
ncbi:MAG: PAS domain-containing protein, partial [bacterium]|nr:PAS domain-containing protein [bacterium]